MQVRFDCPACKKSHVLNMPETTIHLTCSQTGKHLELRLGLGGEVKVRIVDESGEETKKEEDAGLIRAATVRERRVALKDKPSFNCPLDAAIRLMVNDTAIEHCATLLYSRGSDLARC